MIHLLNAPQTTYSKNPIQYRFQCTAGELPFGVLGASASLTTGAGLVTNDTMIVDWTEPMMPTKRLTFFVGAYVLSVYQLAKHFIYSYATYQSIYASATLLDYFEYVAHRIESHPVLSPFFQCTCIETNNQYKILISAKSTNKDWSVKLTDSVIANTHVLNFAYVQTDARPLHHQFLYQLCIESEYESNQYTALPTQYGTCDASGRIELNVSDMLHAHSMAHMPACPIPNWNMILPAKANSVRRYYLRVCEQYGEPLACTEWMYCNRPEQPNNVLLGGLSVWKWQDAWIQDNLYRHQTVTAEQPSFLPFQDRAGGQNVHLHIHIVHFDGSTSCKRMFQNHGIVTKQWETILFPTSVTALQLDATNTLMYRVTVENIDNQFITPSFTYTLDRQWQYQNAYLCFLNAFMLPQIVRFTSIQEVRDYERNHWATPYRPYDDVAQAQGSTFQVGIHWNLEHPKMNVQEFYRIVGLYESNHVYMVTPEGFLPISIENKELQLPKQGEFTTDVKVTVIPKIESDVAPTDWTNDFSHVLKWRT